METEVYLYLASIVMLFAIGLFVLAVLSSQQPRVTAVYRDRDRYPRGGWRRRYGGEGVPGF